MFRFRRGQIGLPLLLLLAGPVLAEDDMQPLRVDPVLLGLPPAETPVAEAPAAAPAKSVETKPVPKPVVRAAAPVKAENAPSSPAGPRLDPATPSPAPASSGAPVVVAPAPRPGGREDTGRRTGTRGAAMASAPPEVETLTALRVDPALLGPAPAASVNLAAGGVVDVEPERDYRPDRDAGGYRRPLVYIPPPASSAKKARTGAGSARLASSGAVVPAAAGGGGVAAGSAVARTALASGDPQVETLAALRVDPALLGLPAGEPPSTAIGAAAPVVSPLPAKRLEAKTSTSGAPARPPAAARIESAAVTPGVETLTALRVDPALLGEPAEPAPLTSYVPPDVADHSDVPPVYSAQLAAGLVSEKPLQATTEMLPAPAPEAGPLPIFLVADSIRGKSDVEMVADGDVELRKLGTAMASDHLVYRELEDEVEAMGHVYLVRNQDEMYGPHMKLRMTDNVGYFDYPNYSIQRESRRRTARRTDAASLASEVSGEVGEDISPQVIIGQGQADRLEFEGRDHYHLSNATYSTCPAGDGGDWYAQVTDLVLDYDKEQATGQEGRVYFKGVPILYSPWLSFSLNNQRKSGFLAPTIGSTSQAGVEAAIPYYWNIAPNMDATITPRVLSKRGTQYIGEFRYLNPTYSGQIGGEYLPDDRLAGRSRSAISIMHTQNFGHGFTGSVNMGHVSDYAYFADLSTALTNVTQTNVLREGRLNYSGGWWSANVLAQRYQTLQDPTQPPIVAPYDRLPQATLTALRPDLPLGMTFNLSGEYVNFVDPSLARPDGKRTILYPQLSLPMQTAAFYLTPKFGVHMTRYQLERQAVGTPDHLNRSAPIFSLDTGATFERDANWFGRDLLQTLEPRIYYVRVPFRDQTQIPIFDTGQADFNFAQIFSENIFSGGDRIADANQATVAVASRFIDPSTGGEYFKAVVGQRYYFSDQLVTLPGVAPRTGHIANYLLGLTGQLTRQTYLDSALEYNSRDKQLERFNVTARYQPEIGKVLNAGYRYTRTQLNQVDFSGQWPLGGGWSGVGRYNYSFKDRRTVESVAGFEYNGSCWVARFVVQRLATTVGRSNSAFFVQLELNGFSQFGSNPIELLKRNIPGYDRSNQLSSSAASLTD